MRSYLVNAALFFVIGFTMSAAMVYGLSERGAIPAGLWGILAIANAILALGHASRDRPICVT